MGGEEDPLGWAALESAAASGSLVDPWMKEDPDLGPPVGPDEESDNSAIYVQGLKDNVTPDIWQTSSSSEEL